MKRLWICHFLLLELVINIHIQSHSQLTNRYNENDYLQELQDRENNLKDSLDQIKTQFTQLQNSIKQLNDTDQQDIALQETLARERDSLYNVEQLINAPFNYTPCNSTQLSS